MSSGEVVETHNNNNTQMKEALECNGNATTTAQDTINNATNGGLMGATQTESFCYPPTVAAAAVANNPPPHPPTPGSIPISKYQHSFSQCEGSIAETHLDAIVEDLKNKTPFMSNHSNLASLAGFNISYHNHFGKDNANPSSSSSSGGDSNLSCTGGSGYGFNQMPSRMSGSGMKRQASSSPEDISNDVTITLTDWERRKVFVGFTKDDEEILSELHLVARTYADDVMVELYNRWLAFPEIRNYFKHPGVLERVKELQKNYFVTLTSGNYGMEYLENRLRIGRKHRDIGLHPRWYMGAYSIYMQIVFPRVLSAFEYDRKKRDRAISALVKLISLDQEVALLSYFGQS